MIRKSNLKKLYFFAMSEHQQGTKATLNFQKGSPHYNDNGQRNGKTTEQKNGQNNEGRIGPGDRYIKENDNWRIVDITARCGSV